MPKFSKHTALQGLRVASLVLGAFILAACGDSPAGISSSGGAGGGSAVGMNADGESVQIGSGTGAGFEPAVLTADITNLQSGQESLISVNLVDGNNNAVSDQFSISFNSNCFGQSLASFSAQTITTTAGGGSTTYTPLGCAGTDTVIATVNIGGEDVFASIDLSIAQDQVQSVRFDSIQNSQIQLAGLGGTEQTDVVFIIEGALGAPVINEEVTFTLSTTQGGIHFAGPGQPITFTDTSDASGSVSAKVQSGTSATNVSVTATWTDSTSGQTAVGVSDDIVISTGFPVEGRMSLSYGPFNPANALEVDGVAVNINIIASDSLGNDVPDGTAISFISPESGNVDNSCVISSGTCTVTWVSAGDRPAGGRATVIAFTDGVEAFTDQNANNVYDSGEPFIDDNEPFADSDESGSYDLGEFFVDTDGDGLRGDVGNGQWDSSLSIAQTLVIVMASRDITFDSLCSTGSFGPPGGTVSVAAGGTVGFSGMEICDRFNPVNPTPIGTTVTFAVEGDGLAIVGGGSSTVPSTTSPTFHGLTIRREVGSNVTGQLSMTVDTPGGDPVLFLWSIGT